ncbi:phosphatidylserine decarboxylase [Helicobacter marmotae]|uniref:Phosphatidylserine decarboxylase n=1 Tax=Helicobacter marmotae TaxID=152490 RepID=A0A3D8I3L8_9HELI|nr:phosphatidylserine decarboxylase [Helicobacter marmotae]RDU59743.1 phosphatidylserine decarboxylase [Helicobacter marmotae]
MTTTQIIAKQGWLGALILLIAFLLMVFFDWDSAALILFIALVLWLVMFRNPERIPSSEEENVFVSPVDGIVRDINVGNAEIRILIETRFIDVGVIRAPCDVLQSKCYEKKGLSLTYCSKDKREVLNAFMEFESLQNRAFSMKFYPIFFSSSELFISDNLDMGERIGFMKAGMTHIIIPLKGKKSTQSSEVEIKVGIGDRVRALQSVIGYFHEV